MLLYVKSLHTQHTHPRPHTHSHTHPRPHTHSHTHTLDLTRTHAHTHSLSLSNSNSEISELPLTLGRLRNCWELTLNGLKINNVPQHYLPGVARGGSTKHLLAYLRAQLRHCVPYNRMKLMAVGLQVPTFIVTVIICPNVCYIHFFSCHN